MGKVSRNWITGMHSGRASSPCWSLDASAGRNRFLGADFIAQLQVLCTTLPGIRDFSALIPNTGMKK